MSKRILLCLAHMSGKEQEFIKEAFDTNWVVPLGPNVDGFERDLEAFVNEKEVSPRASLGRNDKRVVALASGTAAVHLALIACGVGPGDEVLVQSFTFCASTHPITYLGATPVMIDSEPDTWNIDLDLLEEAIKDRIAKTGRKPAAIVPGAVWHAVQGGPHHGNCQPLRHPRGGGRRRGLRLEVQGPGAGHVRQVWRVVVQRQQDDHHLRWRRAHHFFG